MRMRDILGEADKPWDRESPRKKSKKLSSADKSAARARAKRHGRPYPNWIDNAWASKR